MDCKNIEKIPENLRKIIQLSLVCSLGFSDRKAIGAYLIGTFLIIAKLLNYDLAILEAANDIVDDPNEYDDDDDNDSELESGDSGSVVSSELDKSNIYGGEEYQEGKNQRKDLFCSYERYGFRENGKINTEWKCFSDVPYPAMMLELNSIPMNCLTSIIANRSWTTKPSTYCQDLIENEQKYFLIDAKVDPACGLTKKQTKKINTLKKRTTRRKTKTGRKR